MNKGMNKTINNKSFNYKIQSNSNLVSNSRGNSFDIRKFLYNYGVYIVLGILLIILAGLVIYFGIFYSEHHNKKKPTPTPTLSQTIEPISRLSLFDIPQDIEISKIEKKFKQIQSPLLNNNDDINDYNNNDYNHNKMVFEKSLEYIGKNYNDLSNNNKKMFNECIKHPDGCLF